MPDPAAAGANLVTIYTEENTKPKFISMYTRKPTIYDFCIIEKVNENFQPAKFSTDRFMKTAAIAVPESNQKQISYHIQK